MMTDSSNHNLKGAKGTDTPLRSIIKAISWRVLGTLDTLILSYLIITYLGPLFSFNIEDHGSTAAQAATLIAIAEVITKLIIYFLHERIWQWVKWGVSFKNNIRTVSLRRSAFKTATWRILASLDTTLLAWFFTGDLLTGLSIGGFEVVTKLILYFIHERIWQRIQIGIVR